jgi:hypothetical protein
MSRPSVDHWRAAEYFMRYLAGSFGRCLYIYGDNSAAPNIEVYVDALFAAEDRVSIAGFVLLLDGNLIRAFSRRQKHITSSTMESELEALHDAVIESLWYRVLLQELGLIEDDHCFDVYEDNQASIAFAESAWVKDASKHMAVRYFHVREAVDSGLIVVNYISTVRTT